MAVYSRIILSFDGDFNLFETLRINRLQNNVISALGTWAWVTTRSAAYQVTQGTPTGIDGERSAINFKAAFDLDNPTGYVTAIQNDIEVVIDSETIGEDWVGIRTILEIGNENNINATIVNYTAPPVAGVIQTKLKYYISYCDDFNTSRNVFIEKKDHTGGATELLADVNPISISYESSEDFKFSPIRPSVAEVFMIFDSESTLNFEEFWTADEKEFMVKDVKEGTVEWSGYVIPNGFEYEFRGGLYHASIQASDGLGTLDALTFVDDRQKPYGNQDLVYNNDFEFPFVLIITEILKKLELDLDLWTCIDSYERTMTKTGDVRDADPLSSSYINVKTFIKEKENKTIPYWYGSGEEWNCKDVLENVLYIFGAKLYQEFGVWRVKSINADIDYGTGATQRYWRKYNTVATYLNNYETVNDEINIPCNDNTKYLLGDNHSMGMSDVLKSFRMNYEYTFIREGDTPYELITNGDFCDFNNTSILAEPAGWRRWRYSDKKYIRIKGIVIPFADAGGHLCGIEVGTHKVGIPLNQPPTIYTDSNPSIWSSLRQDNLPILKNEQIHIDLWAKYRAVASASQRDVFYQPVFKMVLEGEDNKVYYLRNYHLQGQYRLTWELIANKTITSYNYVNDAHFFYLNDYLHGVVPYSEADSYLYMWKNFQKDIAPAPEGGKISFAIHGLSCSTGQENATYPAFPVWRTDVLGEYKTVSRDWIDEGGNIPRLQLTGISLTFIPNEDESPQQQDYIYQNTNPNYTLQIDPITIYNGDLQNEKHVSNIIVPTNTSGGKNFWDDLGGTYGTSSLGLLTVREIMRQYQKPYRILEGNIKIQDARFGSVYTLSVLPNVRFILQRGTFNKQKQYIENATFVQLTSDVLPDGGSEGGDTLDPNWQPTGVSYCEVINFLNSGYVMIEEEDVNANSETYQDTREVRSVAQDLTQCPLNNPRKYYWGSDDIYLNTATLSFAPFTQVNSKEIQIDFNNTEGNYLYFVHLKTIGGVGQLVERIYTLTTPNNVLADWVYLADRVIDGYIYRVLRTDYVMTEFTGFRHNLVFA